MLSGPVRFGLEQGLLHALARGLGVSLVDAAGAYLHYFPSPPSEAAPEALPTANGAQRTSHVGINGFATLRHGGAPALPSPSTSSTRTPAVVKMKVGDVDGRGHLDDAVRVNACVAATVGETANGNETGHGGNVMGQLPWLRLDANRSWTVAQASAFAAALTPAARRAIAYVEEPLRVPVGRVAGGSGVGAVLDTLRSAYAELAAGPWGALPVALDETLVDVHGWTVAQARGESAKGAVEVSEVVAWGRFAVVKPALVGLAAAPLHRAVGPSRLQKVTLSCTFETGVGLAFLVCVAAWCGEGPGSAGGGGGGGAGSSAHGIHANAAMAAADPWTRRFQVHHSPSSPSHAHTFHSCPCTHALQASYSSAPDIPARTAVFTGVGCAGPGTIGGSHGHLRRARRGAAARFRRQPRGAIGFHHVGKLFLRQPH